MTFRRWLMGHLMLTSHHRPFILVTYVCTTSFLSAAAVQYLQHPVQANPAQMVLLCDQKPFCVFMAIPTVMAVHPAQVR